MTTSPAIRTSFGLTAVATLAVVAAIAANSPGTATKANDDEDHGVFYLEIVTSHRDLRTVVTRSVKGGNFQFQEHYPAHIDKPVGVDKTPPFMDIVTYAKKIDGQVTFTTAIHRPNRASGEAARGYTICRLYYNQPSADNANKRPDKYAMATIRPTGTLDLYWASCTATVVQGTLTFTSNKKE